MALEHLLLLLLDAVELHVAVNSPPLVLGGDGSQEAPRHLRVRRVGDDLGSSLCQLPAALEDLLRGAVCNLKIPVIDVFLTDKGQHTAGYPPPEDKGLGGLEHAELLPGVEVEDLHEVPRLALGCALQRNDVVCGVHKGGLGLHRAPVDGVVLVHVDDDHLPAPICSVVLDADVPVGLHRQVPKTESLPADAVVRQVDARGQRNRRLRGRRRRRLPRHHLLAHHGACLPGAAAVVPAGRGAQGANKKGGA
mmetsp:Transcript_102832/g.290761  ORF Transcript_102832/g.290761 Transcript_102832/m.290761 type:complete len:250 (+) Transcript_102832:4781-5530(+)